MNKYKQAAPNVNMAGRNYMPTIGSHTPGAGAYDVRGVTTTRFAFSHPAPCPTRSSQGQYKPDALALLTVPRGRHNAPKHSMGIRHNPRIYSGKWG